MTVRALDHVNIRTADVPATAAFLADILGLTRSAAPGMSSMDEGCWLHDASCRPIIHVAAHAVTYPSDAAMPFTPASGGGAIHHVALNCDDMPGMLARIEAAGVEAVRFDYPAANLSQLFLRERNGIILELNFPQPSPGDPASA